jgi:tagatose 6-phosphate kinase
VTGFAGGSAATWITARLAEAGIDAIFQPISGSTRTCTAIVELGSRRATEVNEPGPPISEAEVRGFLALYRALFQDASAVVLSGSLPPGIAGNFYATLIALARAVGVPAMLDSSGPALAEGIAAQPLLVKPNAHEAGGLLGSAIHTLEDALQAGQLLRARGAQAALITLGGQGAVLVLEAGAWHAQVPVAHPISSVGCGDALLAGFLAALGQAVQRGASPSLRTAAIDAHLAPHALRLGVACGAANTLHLGAGVLLPDEVERLRDQVQVTALL